MNQLDKRNLGGLLVAVAVSWFLWDSALLYPVRLFATFCHEAGHALATMFTGGHVLYLKIGSNGAGEVVHYGGWRFLIASGGYLGSVFFGCMILLLSANRRVSHLVLEGLGVMMVLLTMLYGRDLFTLAYGLLAGAALFAIGRNAGVQLEFFLAQTLGVLTASMALMDIRTLLMPTGLLVGVSGGPVMTDAQQLAMATWIPAPIWAVLWAGISCVAILAVLRVTLSRQRF